MSTLISKAERTPKFSVKKLDGVLKKLAKVEGYRK
jgi:hypothetical protein